MIEIPKQTLILLSGIPATGKTEFAHYLRCEHSFAHYDVECYPSGWPHPELKEIFQTDRAAFVAQLREKHDRIALDWGFPVHCAPWVRELQSLGVRLVWFDGDIARARDSFNKRGKCKGPIENFENQIEAIRNADIPGCLRCTRVRALSANGDFLAQAEILNIVFPPAIH